MFSGLPRKLHGVLFLSKYKLIGKIEKIPKTTKESPVQKSELEKTERTKQSEGMHKKMQKTEGMYFFVFFCMI